MAHQEQFEFVEALKSQFPRYFAGQKVAEIGSLDLNGSVRRFFTGGTYAGFDVAAGPGVDHAIQGQLIGSATGEFDVSISCECFEHNPFWVETFANMLRMTREGGLVVISCATHGRAEHGTHLSEAESSPLTHQIGWQDYYRNLDAGDFLETFNLQGWFAGYQFLANHVSADLYFYGIRSGTGVDVQGLFQGVQNMTAQLFAKGVRHHAGWLRGAGSLVLGKQGQQYFLSARA